MTLSLKDLCYYLNFDEATWNKNKDMLGYISGETYEDSFIENMVLNILINIKKL